MCAKFFEGLFGGAPAPVAKPPAAIATRETRGSGQIKAEAVINPPTTKRIAGGGNSSIGIGIGTPDSPRKRTTELGL